MLLGPLMDGLLSDRSLCTAQLADMCLLVPDGRAKLSDDRSFTVGKAGAEIRQGRRGQEESDMIGCDQVDEAFELLASIGCQVVHYSALPLGSSVKKRRLVRQGQSVELFGPLQNGHWDKVRHQIDASLLREQPSNR
jgi:hypothetical protein